MNSAGTDHEIRELDRRSRDGVDVSLLWSSRTGRVFVAVEDGGSGEGFHFVVDPADALEAFHHPYAYAYDGRNARRTRVAAASGAIVARER